MSELLTKKAFDCVNYKKGVDNVFLEITFGIFRNNFWLSELQKGCWQCIYNEIGIVEYLKFIKGSWDNSYVLKKLKISLFGKA